jgi:hypothetical protein
MLTLIPLLLQLQAVAQGKPLPAAIENCDGTGQRLVVGSTHDDGEDWFSLRGRVLGPDGKPLCGAEVSATYLVDLPTAYGAIHGPKCPSGINGEFFLDNIRKSTPFRVSVNPYSKVQWKALEDLQGVDAFLKKQHNVQTAGLARYLGEELRFDGRAGVVVMDVDLKADPTATGILAGEIGVAGPFDVDAPALARIIVAGQEPIEAYLDRRTGNFVAYGLPTGKHEVKVEVSTKHQKHALSKTVTVPAGANGTARVSLVEN